MQGNSKLFLRLKQIVHDMSDHFSSHVSVVHVEAQLWFRFIEPEHQLMTGSHINVYVL